MIIGVAGVVVHATRGGSENLFAYMLLPHIWYWGATTGISAARSIIEMDSRCVTTEWYLPEDLGGIVAPVGQVAGGVGGKRLAEVVANMADGLVGSWYADWIGSKMGDFPLNILLVSSWVGTADFGMILENVPDSMYD
ncbi:unnamed protein product [Heligmosomoides polygyrus]|uniref:ABC transmembrane type-1 domain-containing protein n=1 Tax=Heligmosomoides polygyrus TaxID=6339 RepID=A0A183FF72_HELPZ|nr:unnamed protein product [Heligmosomoides polygyrus]